MMKQLLYKISYVRNSRKFSIVERSNSWEKTNQKRFGFYPSMLISIALTVCAYYSVIFVLGKLGIKLSYRFVYNEMVGATGLEPATSTTPR